MSFLFLSSCMVWRRFGSLLNIFIIYIQQNFSHVFSVTIRPSKAKTGRAKKKKLAISWPKFSIASNLKTFLYSKNHQKQTPGSVLHKKAVLKKISKTTEKWLCEAFSSRVTGFLVKILSEQTSEVYPEPCQISKLELFVKKINGFQLLTIFMKRSVLDVYQASGYVSGHSIERLWMVVSRTSTSLMNRR